VKRLAPGQRVTVEGPHSGRASLCVERVAVDGVVLAPLVPPERPALSREPVTVAFTAPGGVYRVAGVATPEPGGGDRLRVLAVGELEREQRREWARVDIVRPAAVEAGDGTVATWTLNVSAGGLLLAGPGALRVGDTVWVRLRLHEEAPPITAQGRIARETVEGYKAVLIEEIRSQDRELVVRFVFDRERHARLMARDG
jgi:PilZ domain